jgi:general secretion pathway protein D
MKLRAAVAALSVSILGLGLTTPATAETNAPVPKEIKDPAADEPLFKCAKKSGEFNVSFKPEIELKELITWINTIVCKTVTLDQRVIATTRRSRSWRRRMSSQEAYRLFLVALATIGYDVVPGDYMKVVESQTIKKENLPLYVGGKVAANEHVIRYAYRPSYAQLDTLVATFNAFKSDAGDVQLIGGMVLITDRGTHVDKMLTLAKIIDVPKGSDGIYLLPVKHADAAKLLEKIKTILGTEKETPATPVGKPGDPVKAPVAAAVPSKIVVDERTNTLILTGSANAYERVRALVEGIDIQLEIEGGASIHVYRLGSSIAEELAKTLESLISGQQRNTTPKPGQPTPPPNAPQQPYVPPQAPNAPGNAGVGTALEGQVKIIADKPTNSLIVMSSGRDYFALKEVIKQLDMPKRQVYIETVILEVVAGSSLDFGTSSHGGIPGTGTMVGGVQLPPLSSLALGAGATTSLPTGFVGALMSKGSSTLFGKSIPSYGVMFQALAGNDNAKLLSAPSIIGVDNEETNHKSGVNIAYERGSSSFVNGGVTTQQNIERKPLELKLWIKPHVFVDDQVMIELKLDSEDLGGEDKLGQPIWTSRNIETRVVVRDQQTVVIGSLAQERETLTATKVPLLGDVPILGHLFKYTKKTKRKTNLIVMMTPYVIKDHMDLQAILDRKTRDTREFSGSFASLDRAKYTPKIDYQRKRGVVEEINRTIGAIEDDKAVRDSMRRLPTVKPGPVELKPD